MEAFQQKEGPLMLPLTSNTIHLWAEGRPTVVGDNSDQLLLNIHM